MGGDFQRPHGRRLIQPLERFIAKIRYEASTGCWFWTAGRSSDGYPCFQSGGRRQTHKRAARWSYEQFRGLIPPGLQIDHLCRDIRCVNPFHLEAVTPGINTRRGDGLAAVNARKTHCLRDHEYNLQNTYVDATGRRHCRACGRDRQRAYREEEGSQKS